MDTPSENEILDAIRANTLVKALGDQPPPSRADEWVTAAEACKALKCSEATFRRRLSARKLVVERQVHGRFVYYRLKNGKP